ncbi:MAG: threonine synthase [Chitinispirillales bacterium]|jgi:threonine synthase|nr:threonine synthase [Chitinispirillales bacterium]
MRYISTRGEMPAQDFLLTVLSGLAPDGGLTMPESYPRFSKQKLNEFSKLSYRDLAFEIISQFADDVPSEDLREIINRSYSEKIFCNGRNPEKSVEITPVIKLDDTLFIQELSNGPTLAFKDLAMQFLGNILEYVLSKKNEKINILAATSGDTGSAAEYAMKGKSAINVFMLSPAGKMSPFQRAQMYSIQEKNIHNIAVKSMFDGCQDLVKAVNKDENFKQKYKIGAVNSINWGRIAAQIVYYFKGYFAAADETGETVDFCVPCGNFGNICAGHIAKQMGLPIGRLIVATNENDVLDEFFSTGKYAPRNESQTIATSSPSMDISKASNLERFVFDSLDRSPKKLKELWKKIDDGGSFVLEPESLEEIRKKYGFVSGKSTHADRISAISEVYSKFGICIDTHTADSFTVAQKMRNASIKTIVLETASAVKFEESFFEATSVKLLRPNQFENIENLPQRLQTIEPNLQILKNYIEKNALN